nr:piggyBac transposable element-derived protein 4-like [Rhipicephalus microplus]
MAAHCDAESDICDDEDVSLDDGEDQSDESTSDEEEEENVCAAEDPLDTLPPSPKARKMEEWQWEEDDSVENTVKHSFRGQPEIKRSIELQTSFWALSRYLHFCNNSLPQSEDRLWKIRPVLDIILKSIGAAYNPEASVVVGESLMKFRGRLSCVRFNPSKRARFGVKFYKLCESSSGYCLNFSIYTGKSEKTPATDGLLCSESVVLDLVGKRLPDGHTIFMDNWYSSPTLFRHLKDAGSNAVGTVRLHRKNMPKGFNQLKLKKGECEVLFARGIMALTWQDKKQVTMLSTVHSGANVNDSGKKGRRNGLPVLKPQVVLDYNRGMGGVDREDQQLASFPIMRRYAKGYKKIFFYIMDIAVYNSYVLFGKATGKRLHYTDWKVNLAEAIFEEVTLPLYRGRRNPLIAPTPMCLQASEWAHFPRQILPNKVKKNPSRLCLVCNSHGKKSESRWECEKCKVALHMPVCFKEFHTRKSY